MVLFNSLEDSELIQEEVRNKKTGKVLRFTFSLNKKESYTPAQANQNAPVQNVSELIENALLKMQMKNNENELLKRLEAMDEKLNGYINDEDEDEDDSDALGGLSLNNPNVINLITLLSQTLGGNKPKASVINGITPDQQKNIEKAVSILSRYDSEIDTDLLKLSALAENQTATFEMLLKTLRSM
jgi:predicted Mrr-cat superfamily restriction endonuclease